MNTRAEPDVAALRLTAAIHRYFESTQNEGCIHRSYGPYAQCEDPDVDLTIRAVSVIFAHATEPPTVIVKFSAAFRDATGVDADSLSSGWGRPAHAAEPGLTEVDLASEYGRLLATRDRLIAEGEDPADLDMPLPPDQS